MKNLDMSSPPIMAYNVIFLSMMVIYTWLLMTRFHPYGKKTLVIHLLINLIPTLYSLIVTLDTYLETIIAYLLFLTPVLVLYRHSRLWGVTSLIALFASQSFSEFVVYLVCALIWHMPTADLMAFHPIVIYSAYFICGMLSMYGVYRFMKHFTSLREKHLRRLFAIAAFSSFMLLFLIPSVVISKHPDFTARIIIIFAVCLIFIFLLFSIQNYISYLRNKKRMELFEREYQQLLEQYQNLDARKEEEIHELHHEIRNCILTLQSMKREMPSSSKGGDRS